MKDWNDVAEEEEDALEDQQHLAKQQKNQTPDGGDYNFLKQEIEKNQA